METRTTPPLPFDLARELPALAPLGRSAWRLHPRRTRQPLPPGASKMGGQILWPKESNAREPWPTCEEHGSLGPLLQLSTQDFPSLPAPRGHDLLQLLWCPAAHAADGLPEDDGYRVYWRNAAELEPLPALPPGHSFLQHTRECHFSPEPFVDFPDYFALDDQARSHLNRWRPSGPWPEDDFLSVGAQCYRDEIAAAPGAKLFGHPAWLQGPAEYDGFRCPQGHEMPFLLQVDTVEFESGPLSRWCPLEDQAAQAALQNRVWDSEILCPAGIMIADVGRLYLFVCDRCPGRPIRLFMQSL
jgi:hypothetical protein